MADNDLLIGDLLYLVRCGHCGQLEAPEGGECSRCGNDGSTPCTAIYARVVEPPSGEEANRG